MVKNAPCFERISDKRGEIPMDKSQSAGEAYSAERLARMNSSPVLRALHISFLSVSQQCTEGLIEVAEDSLNPYGFVHGGVLTALADSCAGVAAAAGGVPVVTVNQLMNFLRPAVGKRIFCVATPQKNGRRIAVYDAVLRNEQGQTVATGVFTFHLDMALAAYMSKGAAGLYDGGAAGTPKGS